MNSKTQHWAKQTGYRGVPYWAYRDQLHAVVRENITMRNKRFEVFSWSRLDSRHQTLASAKARVLELLNAE